jgi:hypothetical protein
MVMPGDMGMGGLPPGLPGLPGMGGDDPTSDLQTFNLFNRLMDESLQHSFYMGADAFFMFWSCLKDERLAIQFLTQLITRLVDVDERLLATKASKKMSQPLQEIVEAAFQGDTEKALVATRSAMLSAIGLPRHPAL